MGYYLLHDMAQDTLKIEGRVLAAFLLEIQKGYMLTNPYHNAIHAADVMQTSYYFSCRTSITGFLRPLDKTLLLLAASIHDYKHDGFNNGFHIATGQHVKIVRWISKFGARVRARDSLQRHGRAGELPRSANVLDDESHELQHVSKSRTRRLQVAHIPVYRTLSQLSCLGTRGT